MDQKQAEEDGQKNGVGGFEETIPGNGDSY